MKATAGVAFRANAIKALHDPLCGAAMGNAAETFSTERDRMQFPEFRLNNGVTKHPS